MKMRLNSALPLLVAAAMTSAMGLAYSNDSAQSGSRQVGRSGPAMTQRGRRMPAHMGPFQYMMRNPIDRSIADVYVLPTMESRLQLSAAQVDNLKQLKQKYLDRQEALGKQVKDEQASLRALFQSTSPPADKVKGGITSLANLRAQQQIASYDMGMQMRGVLNQDQLSRLNAMNPDQMRSYMAAHMTVMEMSQMMRAMRGSMMTGYGMMQGPMRRSMGQHGMMHGPMMQGPMMQGRGMSQRQGTGG